MYENLAIVAAFVFLYSVASGGLERTSINGAIVFTAFGLAVTSFAVAQWMGGSGFIACFVGGLLFGSIETDHKRKLLLAAEGTGDTLALITWVVFGAVVIGRSVDALSWEVVLYAVLSLTVVRMLPVFLSLAGMNLGSGEKLFMGWFGPRGLASIVFAVMVLNDKLPGGDTIAMTVVCTIVLSIIFHGLSAKPLVAALAVKIKRSDAVPASEKRG